MANFTFKNLLRIAGGSQNPSVLRHSSIDGETGAPDGDSLNFGLRLRLISRAISLGDTESLITHPGSLLKARQKLYPAETPQAGVNMDLIRLSVGLEDVEDLIADLKQALDSPATTS